jgi:co-chaperonin GroES (HSP10)
MIICKKIKPLHKDILVYDMFFGEQISKEGIILLDDDKTDRGIHPRWAKVYAVGSEYNGSIEPGQWVLIPHGRWTRGIEVHIQDENGHVTEPIVVRKVDTKDLLLLTDENPNAERNSVVGPIRA